MVHAFHKSDEEHRRYLDNSLKNHLESGRLVQDDVNLIREFLEEARATNQITLVRVRKLNAHLISWRQFIKPFRENTASDLYAGLDRLKSHIREDGKPYAQNTQRDFVLFLKRFYLWMIDNGYSSIPEKKIKAIKPPATNTMTKTAEGLLSEEDIRAMIEACFSSRDRALIACLYEGGFRIGELGNLRWQQVKFTDWNVTVNVNDKTNKPRFVPLVFSRAYLAQWKTDYPGKPESDGYVFLTQNGQPLTYAGVAKQIRDIARRAGIEKHITPHLFRHSRITEMIRGDYNESVIKKVCWGNINTPMFSTYAHLTDSDIEREIAQKAGIERKNIKKRSDALEPRQCPKCYTINAPTHNFCSTCGFSFEDGLSEEDIIRNLLKDNPELLIELGQRKLEEKKKKEEAGN